MSDFRFANVDWIHALWGVLVIAALLAIWDVRGRSALDRLLSRRMQQRLVYRGSTTRRMTSRALTLVALVLLVLAMMRPQWGITVQQSVRVDSQIMICLDVSNSMLAEDVAPNRLERAKVELESLLPLLSDGQQVGLIAFAGRAAVLCPMTTDFGFLRLILAEVEPSSVGLGGTRIGEALRKAVDGFGATGDIQRLILLVTDGEDHDSYPLEVAREAAEKGITIVAVGFGDEAGSRIEITDPRTGVRSFLKDGQGEPVVTRLDGELLRELVMATGGAYIPAGTGALDLESIYRNHLATLLSGNVESQERVVRNEAYQWPVIAAIVALFLGLIGYATSPPTSAISRPRNRLAISPPSHPAAARLLACVLVAAGVTTRGEAALFAPETTIAASESAEQSMQQSGGSKAAPSTTASADAGESLELLPPREVYNRALALVERDGDRAEELLQRARREAGSDGELRYRTLFNLAWVEVHRADAALAAEPRQAVTHLQEAVNRFRESIRVRPDSREARQNLEILSRRLLELTDALNQRDANDLAARLDQLIPQLRAHQGELHPFAQQTSRGADPLSPSGDDALRAAARQVAAAQRQLIADGQRFYDDAMRQLAALRQTSPEELTPEKRVQQVQLEKLVSLVERGLQRLNQSHSVTRRSQGDRAMRRWAAGLSDFKQARDQLRNPVEVIAQIMADATEVAQFTRLLATASTQLQSEPPVSAAPSWLTGEYLQDQQTSITERTRELEMVFQSLANTQTEEESLPAGDAATRQLLDNIRQALPSLTLATTCFQDAVEELGGEALAAARDRQEEGIAALAAAWEWFFDIRRLLEVLYGEQRMADQVLSQVPTDPQPLAEALRETQERSLSRCERLNQLLAQELSQLSMTSSVAPVDPAAATAPPDDAQAARRDQLELAQLLLGEVTRLLTQSRDQLAEMASDESLRGVSDQPTKPVAEAAGVEGLETDAAQLRADTAVSEGADAAGSQGLAADEGDPPTHSTDPRWNAAREQVSAGLERIEALRRLFFTLVEHLRDTAQRQADLNDDTASLRTGDSESTIPQKVGPLAIRQSQLADVAEQLAGALRSQSEQVGADPPASAGQNPSSAEGEADAADAVRRLSEAAEHVQAAGVAMRVAADSLDPDDTASESDENRFDAAASRQSEALASLLEALRLLDNPPPPPEDSDQNGGDGEQQQDQETQQESAQNQQSMSASQLLQLIRDREAERRKERRKQADAARSPVEKDW
jgi:uncharacterized protein YegL